MDRPETSVICPLFDEEENVRPLVSAVREALEGAMNWELILVDDGSGDRTAELALEEAKDPRVTLLRLARNYGQATATQAGFDAARGEVIVTMDGDLQNDPLDIPRLVDKLAEGYDLVVGFREARRDAFLTRTLPSRVANLVIRGLTGVPIRDNGCSLKAYRRDLVERLGLYSDMHRFIPALAVGSTGAQIAQIPVRHRERRFGASKYGLSRVWKVLADLMTVTMLRWFGERPLTMFAYGAMAALIASFGFLGAEIEVLRSGVRAARGVVLPGAVLLLIGLSLYLLMVGLIAQVALHKQAFPRQRPAREGNQ